MSGEKSNSFLMTIVKIILLVAMVCFALPFITVSCGETDSTAKGYEIAIGEFSDDNIQSYDSRKPNVFIIGSALCTLVAFLISFSKKRDIGKTVSSFSFVAVVCLVLFIVTFWSYYDFAEEDKELLEITYEIGFAGVGALNLFAAILSIVDVFVSKVRTTYIKPKKSYTTKPVYDKYDYDEEKTARFTDYMGDIKKDRIISDYKEEKTSKTATHSDGIRHSDEKNELEYTGEARIAGFGKANTDKSKWFQSGGDL